MIGRAPMSAFDAVDGARSAASKCHRLVASKPERFKEVRPGNDGVLKFWRNWRGHDDVMQTRSIRGSGQPAWVNASLNACFRLGPDPRRALWPAASRPHKQAGHMTAPDQCCSYVRKFVPRRRPHMTQSGSRAAQFAVMHKAAATIHRFDPYETGDSFPFRRQNGSRNL